MTELDRLVAARQEVMIRDIQELVRIESVEGAPAPGAPFGLEIKRALTWFLDRGQALGFAAKDVDGYAGHLEFGAGKDLVGILVHLDVVPAGDGWTHPPFGGVVAGGRLYGRGSIDNKGPAVACLHAMAALRESGFQPRKRVRLILGCDEESGWQCVQHYFQREERPLYGFSPDAMFPLIKAEKGQLGLRAFRAWDAGVKGRGIVKVAGGTRFNVVPDYCEALVRGESRTVNAAAASARQNGLEAEPDPEGILLKARGISAHASLPEQGRNAIGLLCGSLQGCKEFLPPEQAETIGFLAEAFGMDYTGAGLGIAAKDEISGPLTLNLGVIDGDATGVRLEIDIRYPVTVSRDELLVAITNRMEKAGFQIAVQTDIPPLHVPADHPLVRKLLRVFRDKTGNAAEPLAIGGRTYACAIGTGVAYGPVFPGRPEVAHQRDEYIDLEELQLMAKIFAAAMAELTVD